MKLLEKTNFIEVEYINHSCNVFEGFYCSGIDVTDYLYNLTIQDREEGILKPNEEWDFESTSDYKDFKLAVAEYSVDKLDEVVTEHKTVEELIIKNLRLEKISSPTYYNYETDRLVISLDVNLRRLEKYCFIKNKDNFSKYLKDNFTSYDGFISFISNNLNDFRFEYNKKGYDSSELRVMIEYYMLTCIYKTTDLSEITMYDDEYRYHFDIVDYTHEIVHNYISKV